MDEKKTNLENFQQVYALFHLETKTKTDIHNKQLLCGNSELLSRKPPYHIHPKVFGLKGLSKQCSP